MSNKLDEVQVFLSEVNCDIFCVSEHWSKKEETQSLDIPGFVQGDFYCRKIYNHGGVGIYIKDQYKYTVLNYIKELSVDKHFECVGVKVFLDKSNYIIVLKLYRSPDEDINVFLENINNVLNYITNRNLQKHFVICGDFNINFLKASKSLTELLDILNSYHITPTIKEPTRLTNCLDNICVNFEDILFDSRVLNSAIADHHAQVLSMILDTPSKEKAVHYTRQINNKHNINYFCTLLAQESWEEVLIRDLDVNVKFNLFSEIITHYFEIAFPVKKKTSVKNAKKKLVDKWHKNFSTKVKRFAYFSRRGKSGDKKLL